MSNLSPESVTYQGVTITTEDFAAFLDQRVPNKLNCQVCGENDWAAVFNVVDGEHLQIPSGREILLTQSVVPGKSNVPVALLTCFNCGYVRMHSLKLLMEWKKTKEG